MPNNKTSPTFKVTSLGCPKNLVDSEIMIGLMGQSGFRVVPTDQPAQVHIINTCSFVGDAKSESIDHILSASQTKKEGGISLLVVTGCLPQRYQKKISRLLPEVDLFVGTGDYERLPTLIAQKLIGTKKRNFIHQQQFLPTHLTPRVQSTAFYTKYVKISEGCSHQCSFCIIPTIRGKLLSRQPEDIVQEIKTGVASGIREFNLVAQDLNEYGRDLTPKSSLNQLLKLTSDIKGDYWIRLLYMYPLQFPDRLIDTIADHPHVARYVDIPLQHISDHLLKKMRRGSSRRYIMRLIDQLKNKIP
ncbi:MAG TPA: MiaB/RimO family radical SAM methylthiotransferase, partial [bacterium]|nr:MiaB/RimO family radical SAM methylthiotransferase [bacterium]